MGMNEIDTEVARAHLDEIRKALDSLDFSPPEGRTPHQVRAANVMNKLATAIGLGGPDELLAAADHKIIDLTEQLDATAKLLEEKPNMMSIEDEKHAAFTELANAVNARDVTKRVLEEIRVATNRALDDNRQAQERVDAALKAIEDVARRHPAAVRP